MPKPPSRTAAHFIPPRPTLPKAREASKECRGCDLWKIGTQTVFGEGASKAELMLVGEQPGNEEDLTGHPFVGPAGKLLDRALAEAGIDRAAVYVDQRREAFQMGAARQAAHSQEAQRRAKSPRAGRGSTPKSRSSSRARSSASARPPRRRCSDGSSR